MQYAFSFRIVRGIHWLIRLLFLTTFWFENSDIQVVHRLGIVFLESLQLKHALALIHVKHSDLQAGQTFLLVSKKAPFKQEVHVVLFGQTEHLLNRL
jgi:hypothetical protein